MIMKHEKIIAKGRYVFELQLESPLSIGSAESEYTDHDILRSADNVPFIPGTSISGPIRSFCDEYFGKNKSFFSMDMNQMISSPFIISDGVFLDIDKIQTTSRDGIAIKGYDENGIFEKTTKDTAKYDYEAIQKGSVFRLVIEYTLRENYKRYLSDRLPYESLEENLNEIENQIKVIAKGFDSHLISLGFKKNRGLGNVSVKRLSGEFFFDDTLKNYLSYKDSQLRSINFNDIEFHDKKRLIIDCKVKLKTPLSIRSYSDNLQDDFDFTQIYYENNGKKEAIIPGSSIMGAIRHQMEKIEKELNLSLDLNDLFGSVEVNDTHQSKIKSEEVSLGNGSFISSTRTSIDRFTGSALDSHLFTQRIYVNQDDEFMMSFKVDNDEAIYPQVGLFLLALNDLKNGYCPLGGSTAIGYGILSSDESIKVNGTDIDVNHNDFVDYLSLCEEVK